MGLFIKTCYDCGAAYHRNRMRRTIRIIKYKTATKYDELIDAQKVRKVWLCPKCKPQRDTISCSKCNGQGIIEV